MDALLSLVGLDEDGPSTSTPATVEHDHPSDGEDSGNDIPTIQSTESESGDEDCFVVDTDEEIDTDEEADLKELEKIAVRHPSTVGRQRTMSEMNALTMEEADEAVDPTKAGDLLATVGSLFQSKGNSEAAVSSPRQPTKFMRSSAATVNAGPAPIPIKPRLSSAHVRPLMGHMGPNSVGNLPSQISRVKEFTPVLSKMCWPCDCKSEMRVIRERAQRLEKTMDQMFRDVATIFESINPDIPAAGIPALTQRQSETMQQRPLYPLSRANPQSGKKFVLDPRDVYQCRKCGLVCASENDLTRHKGECVAEQRKAMNASTRLKCPVCELLFSNAATLMVHKLSGKCSKENAEYVRSLAQGYTTKMLASIEPKTPIGVPNDGKRTKPEEWANPKPLSQEEQNQKDRDLCEMLVNWSTKGTSKPPDPKIFRNMAPPMDPVKQVRPCVVKTCRTGKVVAVPDPTLQKHPVLWGTGKRWRCGDCRKWYREVRNTDAIPVSARKRLAEDPAPSTITTKSTPSKKRKATTRKSPRAKRAKKVVEEEEEEEEHQEEEEDGPPLIDREEQEDPNVAPPLSPVAGYELPLPSGEEEEGDSEEEELMDMHSLLSRVGKSLPQPQKPSTSRNTEGDPRIDSTTMELLHPVEDRSLEGDELTSFVCAAITAKRDIFPAKISRPVIRMMGPKWIGLCEDSVIDSAIKNLEKGK